MTGVFHGQIFGDGPGSQQTGSNSYVGRATVNARTVNDYAAARAQDYEDAELPDCFDDGLQGDEDH